MGGDHSLFATLGSGSSAQPFKTEQDYLMSNSSMAHSDIVAEVERYISIPGQALAYKTDERHIRMLRNRAASI